METQTKTYNGWTNYETWLLKLWIDNEQGSVNYWHKQAEDVDDTISLADRLKEEFHESMPELEGFWCDLMRGALAEVNWYEIAQSLEKDIKE